MTSFSFLELKKLVGTDLVKINDTKLFIDVFHSLKIINKLGNNNLSSLNNLLNNNIDNCIIIKEMALLCTVPVNKKNQQNLRKIPMLPKYSHKTAIISKIECAVILSMAFCNIFSLTKYKNFNFQSWKQSHPEKLKALFNYIQIFITNTKKIGDDYFEYEVIFHRNSNKQETDSIKNNILKSTKKLDHDKKLHMATNKKI